MGKKPRAPERRASDEYQTALRALCFFVAAHAVIRLLDTVLLPSDRPWNVVWLAAEILLGFGSVVTALLCLIRAERQGSPSLIQFRNVFAELKKPVFLLVLIWSVWSVAACFLAIAEGRGSFAGNVRYLCYLFISLLAAFPLGYHLGRRRQMGLLQKTFDICLAVYTLFLLFSCFRFFSGDVHFFFAGNEFDFTDPRVRFGLNPNNTAAYCAFFMMGGLYRFRTLESARKKTLLALSEAVVAAAFIYSESRTVIVALALALGVSCGAAVYRKRGDGRPGSILLAVICGAAAAALTVGIAYGLLRVLHSLQEAFLLHVNAAYADLDARGFDNENSGTLGGRLQVWRAVIRHVFRDRHLLIHGCSQASVNGEVAAAFGKSFNTHNQFLELLLAYGLPALGMFFAWLVWTAAKCISLGLDRSEPEDPCWILAPMMLMLVVNNLAETMLVARVHFVGVLFFLIAGYAGGLVSTKGQPKTQ